MNKISFHRVVPNVFAQTVDLQSEVWKQDVSFEKGKQYLVEAHSGKGKSTFCSYIAGYRCDYSGKIMFDGQNTADLRVADWVHVRKVQLGYLFQELRLFPELTALENIEIKNTMTHFLSARQIGNWFERLGIADKQNTRVRCMSYGQQQRVALVRALAQPFDFLLADEPISHLDDRNARIMGEIMQEEARRQGAGIIVTSIGKHLDLDYERVVKL